MSFIDSTNRILHRWSWISYGLALLLIVALATAQPHDVQRFGVIYLFFGVGMLLGAFLSMILGKPGVSLRFLTSGFAPLGFMLVVRHFSS